MNRTVLAVCITSVVITLISGVTLAIVLGKLSPDSVVQFLAGNTIPSLMTAALGSYLVYVNAKVASVSRQVEIVRSQTNGINQALRLQNDSMVEHLQSLVQPLPVIDASREDAQPERGRHEPS